MSHATLYDRIISTYHFLNLSWIKHEEYGAFNVPEHLFLNILFPGVDPDGVCVGLCVCVCWWVLVGVGGGGGGEGVSWTLLDSKFNFHWTSCIIFIPHYLNLTKEKKWLDYIENLDLWWGGMFTCTNLYYCYYNIQPYASTKNPHTWSPVPLTW